MRDKKKMDMWISCVDRTYIMPTNLMVILKNKKIRERSSCKACLVKVKFEIEYRIC
jgi:hypothetical protein